MTTKKRVTGISITHEADAAIKAYATRHGIETFSGAIDAMALEMAERTKFREGNWPYALTPEQAAACSVLTHYATRDDDMDANFLVSMCDDAPWYERDPETGMWLRVDSLEEIADTCGIVSAIASPGVIATP